MTASDEPWRVCDLAIPQWIDRDDVEQVMALARLEAEAVGDDPHEAMMDAIREMVASERRRNGREGSATDRFSETHKMPEARSRLGWVTEAQRVASLSPARECTDGQKRRFLRNQVILACRIAGFSQRHLARVLHLPHSRIAAIEKEMRAKTGR